MIVKFCRFLFLFFPINAFAAAGIDSVMTTSSVWRMFLSLALVVAIIPLALFGIKKLQGVQHKFNRSTPIKIVTVQALGAKEKLMVVEVEQERLLLGVTNHSISLLKTLSDKDIEFSQYLNNGTKGETQSSDNPE